MGSFRSDLIAVSKSRLTVLVCGIATSIITARFLGPEGNGVIAALTVYPDIFMVFGSLGIRQVTTYFVGQKKYSDNEIFSTVSLLWFISSVVSLIVCYFLVNYTIKNEYSNHLLFLAIIPIPFALFNTYSSGIFLGKNQIKEFNAVNWIPNVIKLIVFVLLIIVFPLDVKGALIGLALGYVILTFFVWKKLKPIITGFKFILKSEVLKRMISLGAIYAISLLIINLNYKVDVIILERLSSERQVGLYTKGVSIVQYLWEVPTLLSTIVFARSASSKAPKDFSFKVTKLLRICLVIILFGSIVFYLLSEFIMVALYGKEFLESSTVQKYLLPGIFLLTLFKVLNMDLAGRGKPWLAIFSTLPALVLNIILNYSWAAEFGANGAALASTISYSVSAIIFLIVYSRTVNISIGEILMFKKDDFDFLREVKNKIKK
ncbi:flippase [Zunongwangia endophytica]|uniref:Flippase n=1 Tax=Zunongwangia endophytica TaxID=1808945 RepID=A0ABV8H8R5_9FLAO|nr:flippase [Zunongwangia endophytica]MDN3596241.1 flippase [Zunongwangia endophytica]